MHLERTTSELELKSEKSKIGTFCLEFNGQVCVRQDYFLNLYSLQSILNLTPAFVISCCIQEVKQRNSDFVLFCTNNIGSIPFDPF